MGKCFLGLGFGTYMALAYFVSYVTKHGEHWANALPGAIEWLLTGALLTACAIGGYAVHLACERRRERRRR